MTTTAFGRNVKCLREEKGLTQVQLADALSVSEVSVWQWENGRVKYPRHAEIRDRLKEFFGASDSDLFGYADGYYAKKHGLPDAQVKPASGTSVPVKVLGAAHAGEPDEPFLFDGETMLYEHLFKRHPRCFALRVNGTCMDKDFTDKDVIFVDPDLPPEDGSIGVVIIDGESVVRRVRLGNNSMMLVAESTASWDDILVMGDEHDVSIVGTVFWWQSSVER